MKLFSTLVCSLLFALPGAAPRAQAQVPSGRDVVSVTTAPSLDPAARGRSMQVAVVLKIRPGFHINARKTSADYLIATDLKAEAPTGFKLGEVAYPSGKLHTFSFSKTPLNVYEGTVVLRLPLAISSSAAMGEQHIPLKLRYQACSSEICLPPVTQSVDTVITVASAARSAHSGLFSPR